MSRKGRWERRGKEVMGQGDVEEGEGWEAEKEVLT